MLSQGEVIGASVQEPDITGNITSEEGFLCSSNANVLCEMNAALEWWWGAGVFPLGKLSKAGWSC